MAVTWDHSGRKVLIYADGKAVADRLYSSSTKFFQPSGRRYQIGNRGYGYQFYGSVMELYVFGTVLSRVEINTLRGELGQNDKDSKLR